MDATGKTVTETTGVEHTAASVTFLFRKIFLQQFHLNPLQQFILSFSRSPHKFSLIFFISIILLHFMIIYNYGEYWKKEKYERVAANTATLSPTRTL